MQIGNLQNNYVSEKKWQNLQHLHHTDYYFDEIDN